MLIRLSIFSLLVLANASPATKRGTSSFDMVSKGKGNYNVINCGQNTDIEFDLLDKLYSSLLPVIQDAESTNPSAAYTAFFKDPSYAPFISTLFTNVTTGVPRTPPALYSFNGRVSFMCVTATKQFTFTLNGPHDAYTDCLANPKSPVSYFGFVPPKQFVVLCPSFFTGNYAPVPPPNKCLTVSTYRNTFRGNGEDMRRYQMWILLDMIVRYYLYTSTGIFNPTIASDVNQCFRLAAKSSALNPYIYVYYAASKSSSDPETLAEGHWHVASDLIPPRAQVYMASAGISHPRRPGGANSWKSTLRIRRALGPMSRVRLLSRILRRI